MFKRANFDRFVCLSDITNRLEEYNPVIYNPAKDPIPFRVELLFRTIKEHTGVELTSEQLTDLTKYEIHQLNEFVEKLRKILIEARK